jgi:hypothetical protein
VSDTPTPVATGEIADLLAWARRLSTQGDRADPTERAAYQAAKADLLTRITADKPHHGIGGDS